MSDDGLRLLAEYRLHLHPVPENVSVLEGERERVENTEKGDQMNNVTSYRTLASTVVTAACSSADEGVHSV